MASYTTGKELYEKMLALQEKTSENIAATKQVLKPRLEAQGLTLTEGNNYSSIINDMKKMITVERNIENGKLDQMTFVENGLFNTSILPSNAVMLSKNRIIFVEEGLLYIMDFDTTSMLTTYKKIYKIDVIWDLCKGTSVNLLYDDFNHNVFIYPTYGDKIVAIHGEGIYTTGEIVYNTIDLIDRTNIIGLSYIYMEVAFITGDNRYCRIYDFDNTVNYSLDDPNIDNIAIPFTPTNICDGGFNYVSSNEGSVYRYSPEAKKFTFISDILNEHRESVHTIKKERKPENYPPILAFVKNNKRVSILTHNAVYTSYSDNILDIDNPLTACEIPYEMVSGRMSVNRRDSESKTYVLGFDNSMNAVAFTFTNEHNPIDIVELGNGDDKPGYAIFNCCDEAGVMIQVYETILKASDYYTADEIAANGYKDFPYTSITMKVGMYEGDNYQFTQEFIPLFVPEKIVAEKETTVITSVSPSSPLFNIAVTNDHLHWYIVNIPDEIAINVQDIASGENTFVMVGLFSDHILVSNYGYEWRAVTLPKELSFVSVTYSPYYKKFYAMTNDGTGFIEYNPSNDEIIYVNIGNGSAIYDVMPTKIISCSHKLYLTFRGSHKNYVYETCNSPFDTTPLGHGIQMKNMIISNEYDSYYGKNVMVRDIVEIGDDIFTVLEIDEPWDSSSSIEYTKKLITGMIIHNAKYDIDLTQLSNSIDRATDRIVFPLDPDEDISLTMYLNHLVINHPSNKGYINANNVLPITYGEIHSGKYYAILANAKSSASSEGYLHIIQNHVNSFTRYSYIVTTDSWYDPTVTAADLDYGKNAFRVKEYGLEMVSSEVDKNGNIDVYPAILSNIKNETGSSIIYTDRFYMVTKGKYLYMSDDGMNWSFRQMPKAGDWRDIVYNGSMYVAVNYIDMENAEIWYTNNLYKWTRAELPVMLGWSELTICNGVFRAVAGYLANNNIIIKSEDGINWTSVSLGEPLNTIRVVDTKDIDEDAYWSFNTISGSASFNRNTISGSFIEYDAWKDKPVYAISGTINGQNVVLFGDGTIGFKSLNNGSTIRVIAGYLKNKPKYLRSCKDGYGRYFYFFYNLNENYLYMSIVNDDNDSLLNLVKIDLPVAIDRDCTGLFCYQNGKIIIATSQPIIIDLADTYPDIIESSFNVMSGETYRVTLPFTPDHVFLFGAKSYNTDNRFIIGEIHKSNEFSIDGSGHNAMKFFNNTLETIAYRSDISDKIIENGFVFTNNTLNDRHINYIAIKEDHYK